MITETFLQHFERDLLQLKEEISLYKNENDLWIVKGDIKNSAGNLALHIIGNLKHFIGAQLGGTGYVRQRDKEFSDRNLPREKIFSEIDEALSILKKVLSDFKDEELNNEYPIEFLGAKRTIGFMLVTLSIHFSYHLGQINYHRRLL